MRPYDLPALGAFLGRPDVVRRRHEHRENYLLSRADHRVRHHAVAGLGDLQRAALRGRPLHHLADDIEWLAEKIRSGVTAAVHVDDLVERPITGLTSEPFEEAA